MSRPRALTYNSGSMAAKHALLLVLLVAAACGSQSDESLLRRFPTIRADLEQVLRGLPAQASFVRIASSWSDPQLPNEQLAPIRAVLKRADIGDGLLVREGASLFIVESHGMVGRGWAKGFAYVLSMPATDNLRVSLDDPRALPKDGLFLRPIPGAPAWYVFVDR